MLYQISLSFPKWWGKSAQLSGSCEPLASKEIWRASKTLRSLAIFDSDSGMSFSEHLGTPRYIRVTYFTGPLYVLPIQCNDKLLRKRLSRLGLFAPILRLSSVSSNSLSIDEAANQVLNLLGKFMSNRGRLISCSRWINEVCPVPQTFHRHKAYVDRKIVGKAQIYGCRFLREKS